MKCIVVCYIRFSRLRVENHKLEFNTLNFKTLKQLIVENMAKKCNTVREKRGQLSNYSKWVPPTEP